MTNHTFSPSEATTEMREFTNELKNRRDELLQPLYFEELLELAESVCLAHTPTYPERHVPQGEARIIAAFGTRGLKAAYELSLSHTTFYPRDEQPASEEDEQRIDDYISLTSPIRHPEVFSQKVDFNILAKAEAFGAQLIEESFRVLGSDAYAKAEQYAAATSADEQLRIIRWLDKRLRAMVTPRPAAEDGETPEPAFYHPARLSPKLIGSFPHHKLDPTCLSVSIIATSFFRRAGVDALLHADVTHSAADSSATYLRRTAAALNPTAERLGITLSDQVVQSVDKIQAQAESYERRFDTHHSAVYVRLIDNTWAQFDSNYRASVHLERTKSEILDNAYETLRDTQHLAPHLELSLRLGSNTDYCMGEIAQLATKLQTKDATERLRAAVRVVIEEDPIQPLPERIYTAIEAQFFAADDAESSPALPLLNLILQHAEVITPNGYQEQHLRNLFYHLFPKYVLWGENLETVVQRMSKDTTYRDNRIEDIVTLPLLMLLGIARDEHIEYTYDTGSHYSIEVGHPEQRIGLAVLSDFAAHTNAPLTPTFWLSHWPGGIPPIETIEGASHSSLQDSHLYNNLAYQSLHALTSHKNYDIIKQFFDLRSSIQ